MNSKMQALALKLLTKEILPVNKLFPEFKTPLRLDPFGLYEGHLV